MFSLRRAKFSVVSRGSKTLGFTAPFLNIKSRILFLYTAVSIFNNAQSARVSVPLDSAGITTKS